MLWSASLHALPKEVLQDIWVEHLMYRSERASSPLAAEKELRLVLHLVPETVRGIMVLAEQYMLQEHYLGTAMLSGLGVAWHVDEESFGVFHEETTTLLNLNSRSADLPSGQVHALLSELRSIPLSGRGAFLLAFEVEKIRPLLASYPHSKDLLLMLSQVFQTRQEWTLLCAVNLYALDVAGETLPFVNNLVLGLSEIGRLKEAERWVDEWLLRYSTDRTLLAHRALLHLNQGGSGEELLKRLSAWIEADRSNLRPYELRAKAYLSLGRYRDAERDLFYCMRVQPENAQTYLTLLELALQEEDGQQALVWLKKYRSTVPFLVYMEQLELLRKNTVFKEVEGLED